MKYGFEIVVLLVVGAIVGGLYSLIYKSMEDSNAAYVLCLEHAKWAANEGKDIKVTCTR